MPDSSRSILLRFVLPLLALAATPARGSVFWLGGGGAPCNFSSLAIALGAVGQGDTIRIANNQAYADINLSISDQSVTLEGGWADCAGTPSDERPVLEGAPGANLPVLRIDAAGTARSVQLNRLEIRGGTRSGIEIAGLVDARLEDTLVDGNSADDGGGIQVYGTSPTETILRLVHSVVGSPAIGAGSGNTADVTGGGVRCTQARVQLSSALIQGNAADFGAGLYLQGCLLDAAGPGLLLPGYPPLSAMIRGNVAEFFGGGLYAESAADLSLDTSDQAVVIDGNAASRGGGVYLIGAGTHFDGAAITISNNAAGSFGGGVYVQDGAAIALARGDSGTDSCFAGRVCSRIVGNSVAEVPTSAGGAIQVIGGSALVSQTEISGNVSHAGQSIFHVQGGNLRLIDSLVHGNDAGVGHLALLYEAGTHLTIDASTLAANASGSPLVGVAGGDATSSLYFARSVIWQPDLLVHDAPEGEPVTVACMNAHPGSGIDAATDDPAFVDAAAGDYRLRAGSPNVDACEDPIVFGGGGGGDVYDLFGTPRPIALLDASTPFDRGALELTDAIFADGFEPLVSVP